MTEDIGQVSVQWILFGSSGHVQQPSSIIQGFTKRLNYDGPVNRSFNNPKSICRSSCLRQLGIHHSTHDKQRIEIVINSEKDLIEAPLHLNHYVIQSLEYFTNIKMTRGDVSTFIYDNVRNIEYFKKFDVNNIEDTELALRSTTELHV